MIDNLWQWITFLGTPELWLGVAAGVVIIFFYFHHRFGKRRDAIKGFMAVFVIALLLTFGLVLAVKDIMQVPRPCSGLEECEEGFSFPSGHAASIFVVFTSLVIVGRKWLPVGLLAVVVAYSRIALGVHTPVDVLAGTGIGIAIPLAVWSVLRKKGKI